MPCSFKNSSAKRPLTESRGGGSRLKNFFEIISCGAGVEIGGAENYTQPPIIHTVINRVDAVLSDYLRRKTDKF